MDLREAVVEYNGWDQPILVQIDFSSMESLYFSLTKAAWSSKTLTGQVMFWERGKRSISFLSTRN